MDIVRIYQIMNTIFAGIFGLVIGSFLNVCIYRIPEGRTIVKGHSMCMSCGHELGALDLVPLFSWIFLKGKCRYCGSPIASRYAKIEGLTGIVFAVLSWQRRASFYFPGSPLEDLLPFLSLIILLLLAAVVIVSMMIQKDHRTGMYRLSAGVIILYVARVSLRFFDRAALKPVLLSSLESLLISALVILLLMIFCPLEFVSLRTAVRDICEGKTIRKYFAPANRTIRTTDVLFLAICTAIGFPAACICIFAYAAARSVGRQEVLLPYLGIIIAASALLGVIIFPGYVF